MEGRPMDKKLEAASGQEAASETFEQTIDGCSFSAIAPPEQAASAPQLLRPYQTEVIDQCRQQLAIGHNKICLVAPTASGKTIIAAEIIRQTVANDKRVLVLAHTREIVGQTS